MGRGRKPNALKKAQAAKPELTGAVKETISEAVEKVEEAVETVEAKTEAVEETVEQKVQEVKKAPARRGRKTTAKKEKEAAGTEMILQYGNGGEVRLDTLEDKVKAKFVEQGHRAGCIRSLQIYVKPEDGKAYYVINNNDKYSDSVDLF